MPPKAFADLHHLDEDERIKVIACYVQQGNITAVFVDDDPTADRYVKKLEAAKCHIIKRLGWKNTVLLQVGPVPN